MPELQVCKAKYLRFFSKFHAHDKFICTLRKYVCGQEFIDLEDI